MLAHCRLSAATALLSLGVCVLDAAADLVMLEPERDNTLYEDPLGQISNGAGIHLFSGRNSQGNTRRALLAFDIAGAVPVGATIDSVTLTLHVSQAAGGPAAVSLHRLLADWGEGASDAPMSEGQGAPAEPGDATWLHTFFDGQFWTTPGGDFDPVATATTTIGDPGFYTYDTSPALVSDVQGWLDDPLGSYGWLVRGDESDVSTAKRLDSRENDAAFRPQLTVMFTPLPSPAGVPLLGLALLWPARRRRR